MIVDDLDSRAMAVCHDRNPRPEPANISGAPRPSRSAEQASDNTRLILARRLKQLRIIILTVAQPISSDQRVGLNAFPFKVDAVPQAKTFLGEPQPRPVWQRVGVDRFGVPRRGDTDNPRGNTAPHTPASV